MNLAMMGMTALPQAPRHWPERPTCQPTARNAAEFVPMTAPPPRPEPRAPAPAGWRVRSSAFDGGAQVPPHQHADAQLVFALRGVMQVHTGDAQWTIPPQRALWMPPAHRHSIRLLSRTEMRSVYFSPALLDGPAGFKRQAEVHVITASPLIRELVSGLFVRQRAQRMRGQMAALLLQALDESPCLPTQLPMPTGPRLQTVLAGMTVGDCWRLSLGEAAGRAAMSERSFSRHFSAEVGMSFRAWRQRARLIASLDLLASPRAVKEIAAMLGFSDAAAYVSSFKALMGCTPGEFREAGHA
jgi:AraC-like DNA-binding protein/quercetin dioxygenase-like cupin family protein